MFGKKKSPKDEAPSLQQLFDTAVTLKYIGDFLLTSQVSGDECEAHTRAIKMTHAQFQSVTADVEKHPDYPAFLEKQREAQKAREAAKASKANA